MSRQDNADLLRPHGTLRRESIVWSKQRLMFDLAKADVLTVVFPVDICWYEQPRREGCFTGNRILVDCL